MNWIFGENQIFCIFDVFTSEKGQDIFTILFLDRDVKYQGLKWHVLFKLMAIINRMLSDNHWKWTIHNLKTFYPYYMCELTQFNGRMERYPWIFHEHYHQSLLCNNWFYTGLAAAIYAPTTGTIDDIRNTQTFTYLLIIGWITFYLPIIVKGKTLVFNTRVTVEYERHCQFQARSSQNVTYNSRQTIQIFQNRKKVTETHDGFLISFL